MRRAIPLRTLTAAALSLALLAAPLSGARAQSSATVEAQPEVIELNEEGVRLAVLGESDKAIETFQRSLELQPLNITWVNLGRTIARSDRADRCEAAREAYANALTAQRVAEPSYQQVLATVDAYMRDLDEQCEAAGEAVAVPDDPVDPVDPVEPIDPVEPRPVEPRPVEPRPVEPATTASFSPWSWIALGTGVALLGTVVALDVAVLGPKFDELDETTDEANYNDIADSIETTQAVNYALLGVGSAALITGVVLVVLDVADDSRAVADHGLPGVIALPDGAAVGWSTAW